MDRGIPTSSKLVSKKINDRNRQIHLSKLGSIKSTISRVPPQAFAHLKSNKKKIQITEDKLTQIERENKLLLDKLTVIMKSAYNSQPNERVVSRSLNRDSRKRELVKITIENQAFSRRLQEKKSAYDVGSWVNNERQREGYLKNISEYPFVLLENKALRAEDRPQSFQLSRGDLPSFLSSPANVTKFNSTSKDATPLNELPAIRRGRNDKLNPVTSNNAQQILHQSKRKIGFSNYLIHIYFHNEVLNIIASNNERADFKTFSIPKKEGEQLLAAFDGDYEALIDQIQFKGNKIVFKNLTLDNTQKNSVFYTSNVDIAETHDENDQEGSATHQNNANKVPKEANTSQRSSQNDKDRPHVVEAMKKEQKKAQTKSQTNSQQNQSIVQAQSQSPAQDQDQASSDAQAPTQSQTQADTQTVDQAVSQNQEASRKESPNTQKTDNQEQKEQPETKAPAQIQTGEKESKQDSASQQKLEAKQEEQPHEEVDQGNEEIEDEAVNSASQEGKSQVQGSSEERVNGNKESSKEEASMEASNIVSEKVQESSVEDSKKVSSASALKESLSAEEPRESTKKTDPKEQEVDQEEIQDQAEGEEEDNYSEDFEVKQSLEKSHEDK